jgi:hypothetical protein
MGLTFDNGQYAVVTTRGLLGMHRPTVAWDPDAYTAGIVHGYETTWVVHVGVGDWFDVGPTNSLALRFTSTSLTPGKLGITQLIIRDSSVESWEDWRLDNSIPYQAPDDYSLRPDGTYRAAHFFTDMPSMFYYAAVYCYDQFEQYFMFRPNAPGSIWVTLGTANWSWSGNVDYCETCPGYWEFAAPPYFYHSQGIQPSTAHPEWRLRKTNLQ